MPYSKSKARKEFDLLTSCLFNRAKDAYKSKTISYDTKQMVFQSFFFSTSANIENYLVDVFSDWVKKIKSIENKNLNLPENLRTRILIEKQKQNVLNYWVNGDDNKLFNKLNIKSDIYNVIHDHLPTNINQSNILMANKYPSVKNIKTVFLRVGIKDIFGEIRRKRKRDVELDLRSFLDIRENIAHSSPDTITIQTLKTNYCNILGFINAVDRVLFTIIKVKFWTNC
jgi:hypothetical protein